MYIKNNKKAVNDVCNAINVNGGATNSQCLLALCYYFHAPTYNPVFLSYCLSFAAMDNVIGHDDPIFVVGKNSDTPTAER